MYVETSSPALVGNTARLLSKTFPSTTARCMKFWYNMYGSGVGSLGVYMKNELSMEMIWGKQGNQGEGWIMDEVTVQSPTEFKVICTLLIECH